MIEGTGAVYNARKYSPYRLLYKKLITWLCHLFACATWVYRAFILILWGIKRELYIVKRICFG